MFELLQLKNLILHHYINTYLVDDILYRDGMVEKEEEKDFTTLLIKWYLEQKKAKDSITSDKVERNAKNE